jgi:uncharacterized protein (TIGR00290 family)
MSITVLVSWSGGKDSALALYDLQSSGQYEVMALLTTVALPYNRISMHGVRCSLLEQQAESLGLPLEKVLIPAQCSNENYEIRMAEVLTSYKAKGVQAVVHGDLFLEDIRAYRERNLARIGLEGLFPLWGQETRALAHRFMDSGFKAVLCCVNPKVLHPSFAGRIYDKRLLVDFPTGVDPCGEYGEFHSFTFAGPIFRWSIPYCTGDIVERDGFTFCDLLPANAP